MKKNIYIQKFYLNFLCSKELYKDAAYFAIYLELKENLPPRLLQYFDENPEKIKSIKEEMIK